MPSSERQNYYEVHVHNKHFFESMAEINAYHLSTGNTNNARAQLASPQLDWKMMTHIVNIHVETATPRILKEIYFFTLALQSSDLYIFQK